MAYDNELKFALFKNDKGDNQARPDYRGECTVGGKVYRISGWIADIKNGPKTGTKYIRGSLELDQPKPSSAPANKPATQDNADQDVPF